jgi:hypothetical protein
MDFTSPSGTERAPVCFAAAGIAEAGTWRSGFYLALPQRVLKGVSGIFYACLKIGWGRLHKGRA